MKLIFAIVTPKHNHTVSFDPFDKNGKNAFDQAVEYTVTNYNDPNDKPALYLCSPVPLPAEPLRTPAMWEAMLGIEIIDADGWRRGATLGEKSMLEFITEKEFVARCDESTIREEDIKRLHFKKI